MKQPYIKIYGFVHKVREIEFSDEGLIVRCVYQINENNFRTVFKEDRMVNKSLTSDRKIQKPTKHPYHEYDFAPDIEKLLL